MIQEVTKRLLVKRSADTQLNLQCSVIATLRLFAAKWKPCILCYLGERLMRYNLNCTGLFLISAEKCFPEHSKRIGAGCRYHKDSI